MKKRRFALVLGVSLAGIFLAFYLISFFSVLRFSRRDETRPADCAIVLGASAAGGEVSPVLRERIEHAIRLYEAGTVGCLIMTGGTETVPCSEAESAAKYAVSRGVAPEDVYFEDRSQNTEENLAQAKLLMTEHGLRDALVVSDPYHMKRAMLQAAELGITAFSSPTDSSMYRSLQTKLPFLAREGLLYLFYSVKYFFS